jgi:hypothetical protein
MKFEELLEIPLHELTDEDINSIIDDLNASQLSILEKKMKTKVVRRKRATPKKKHLEDELSKAMLGTI